MIDHGRLPFWQPTDTVLNTVLPFTLTETLGQFRVSWISEA